MKPWTVLEEPACTRKTAVAREHRRASHFGLYKCGHGRQPQNTPHPQGRAGHAHTHVHIMHAFRICFFSHIWAFAKCVHTQGFTLHNSCMHVTVSQVCGANRVMCHLDEVVLTYESETSEHSRRIVDCAAVT
jgi:hypothetical protein